MFEDISDFQKQLADAAKTLASYEKIVFVLAGDGSPGKLEIYLTVGSKQFKQSVPLECFFTSVKQTFHSKRWLGVICCKNVC